MQVAISSRAAATSFNIIRPFSALVEPKSIKELEMTGMANLAKSKPLDYSLCTGHRSFEADINS